MNSVDLNKVIGSVLGTVLFVLVLKMIVIPVLYYVPPPAKPGYVVQGVQETAATLASAPEQETMPDWGTVLPKADVAKGQQIAQRCQQCHNWVKGGPNAIGPNLWGVVGRARASVASFSYSSAMAANHDPWTYDKLFQFWKSPGTYVPGTKMSFAGLKSADDRVNLLAYMRLQSDSPLPIPPPAPVKPATANPPASGAAATPTGTKSGAPAAAPANAAPKPAGPPAPATGGKKTG